jgi:hypothetical protein
MAKIRLVRGAATVTKRNFVSMLPTYLTYVNTVLIIVLLVKVFTR